MFRLRRKKKEKVGLEEKDVALILHRELAPYITRDELKEYLEKIKSDEKRQRLWDSLSMRQKIRVLRYVSEKKGGKHDGK